MGYTKGMYELNRTFAGTELIARGLKPEAEEPKKTKPH